MKKFLIFLFCALLCSNLSAAGASRTLQEWKQQYKRSPNDTLVQFNYAVSLQQVKQYPLAISLYKSVIASKSPLRVLARYFLSQIYLNQGRATLAKTTIIPVRLSQLPPNLRKRIAQYKRSLEFENNMSTTGVPSRQFSGYFATGYGVNSNAQFLSKDEVNASESEGQLSYFGQLNYKASRGASHDVGLRYSAGGRSYSASTASNDLSQSLAVPISFYSSDFRIHLSPNYALVHYSDRAFAHTGGAHIELKKRFSTSFLALALLYENIDIIDDDFAYLNGERMNGSLQWHRIWSVTNLFVTYTYGDNRYQDSDVVSPSYAAHQLDFAMDQTFHRWKWQAQVSYQTRTYSFDVTENDTRKDHIVSASIYGGYRLTPSWTSFLQLRGIRNRSNFGVSATDDKNYRQLIGNTGISFIF